MHQWANSVEIWGVEYKVTAVESTLFLVPCKSDLFTQIQLIMLCLFPVAMNKKSKQENTQENTQNSSFLTVPFVMNNIARLLWSGS